MTERLYYHDSFLREFDARVISCESVGGQGSGRWSIVLDRTAFYPTSGGQPHDLGTLEGTPVVEVVETQDHQVVHYTSANVAPGTVHGVIDWSRRFDHMQQHTGQHLLSAAFLELFNFPTISFHLGREASTIDLDVPSVVPRHLEEAERRTNEIIFEDRLVAVRFGTAKELGETGIRKKVEREGVLRAIEIEGFDRQPCGGTHLARTGQAGLLLIRKLERRRDSWRLVFVCGFRALGAARGDFGVLTHAASLLSCGLPDVPLVVGKTLDQRRAEHSAAKRLESRLAEHEARALLASHVPGPFGGRVIVVGLDEATPDYLRLLGARLAAEPGVVALLASRSSGHVTFAQAGNSHIHLGNLLRDMLREFGGKGGGSEHFAQGSLADPARVDAVLSRAQNVAGRLNSALPGAVSDTDLA